MISLCLWNSSKNDTRLSFKLLINLIDSKWVHQLVSEWVSFNILTIPCIYYCFVKEYGQYMKK